MIPEHFTVEWLGSLLRDTWLVSADDINLIRHANRMVASINSEDPIKQIALEINELSKDVGVEATVLGLTGLARKFVEDIRNFK